MVNYDTANSQNLDHFILFDTSINYNLNWLPSIKSSIAAGALNVTNRNNQINSFYKVDPNDSSKAIRINNKSLGLTPNIRFGVNF